MKPRLLTALVATLLGASACDTGAGHGVELRDLVVNDAPPNAAMRAGYGTLVNHDERARVLHSVTSPAFEVIEFHITETQDGISRMRRETDLQIPARQALSFEPFGRHLMLMGPTVKLGAGDTVALRFCFADGECVDGTAPVRRVSH